MFGSPEDVLLASGYLNAEDNAEAGALPGLAGLPGQLGRIIAVKAADALRLSKTATGTLYGGLYQIVKFKAGTTAAPARGQIVYWDDRDDFVVTPDAPTDARDFAGVVLNPVTKGNHGIIQVGGLATVLCKATVTVSQVVGGPAIVVDDLNTVDGNTLATAATLGDLTRMIGRWNEVPTNGGLKQMQITGISLNV